MPVTSKPRTFIRSAGTEDRIEETGGSTCYWQPPSHSSGCLCALGFSDSPPPRMKSSRFSWSGFRQELPRAYGRSRGRLMSHFTCEREQNVLQVDGRGSTLNDRARRMRRRPYEKKSGLGEEGSTTDVSARIAPSRNWRTCTPRRTCDSRNRPVPKSVPILWGKCSRRAADSCASPPRGSVRGRVWGAVMLHLRLVRFTERGPLQTCWCPSAPRIHRQRTMDGSRSARRVPALEAALALDVGALRAWPCRIAWRRAGGGPRSRLGLDCNPA